MYLYRAVLALLHGCAFLKLLFSFDFLKAARTDNHLYLGYVQALVELLDSLVDKFLRVEMHRIVAVDIDFLPQTHEFVLELLLVEVSFHGAASIGRLHLLRVEHAVKLVHDGILDIVQLAKIELARIFVGEVFVCQLTTMDIALLYQHLLDVVGNTVGNGVLRAVFGRIFHADEQIFCYLHGAVGAGIGNLML